MKWNSEDYQDYLDEMFPPDEVATNVDKLMDTPEQDIWEFPWKKITSRFNSANPNPFREE